MRPRYLSVSRFFVVGISSALRSPCPVPHDHPAMRSPDPVKRNRQAPYGLTWLESPAEESVFGFTHLIGLPEIGTSLGGG